MTEPSSVSVLPSVELDNLYAISQVNTRVSHWKPALDQMIPLLRAILRRLSGLFEADRQWQDAQTAKGHAT